MFVSSATDQFLVSEFQGRSLKCGKQPISDQCIIGQFRHPSLHQSIPGWRTVVEAFHCESQLTVIRCVLDPSEGSI